MASFSPLPYLRIVWQHCSSQGTDEISSDVYLWKYVEQSSRLYFVTFLAFMEGQCRSQTRMVDIRTISTSRCYKVALGFVLTCDEKAFMLS